MHPSLKSRARWFHPTRWSFALVIVGAGASFAACSSEESDERPAPPYASESSFCDALASRVCSDAVVEGCYQSDDSSLSADTDACRAAFLEQGNCNPRSYEYGAKGAEECLASQAAAYADGRLDRDELADLSDKCLAVFSARNPEGTPCARDDQCDGTKGHRCVSKPAESGACYAPVEIDAGSLCNEPDARCEEGYYCGADEACVQNKPLDSACSETVLCDSQTRCVNDVCVEKLGNGSDCASDDECLNGFCILADGAASGSCGSNLPINVTTAGACDPFISP